MVASVKENLSANKHSSIFVYVIHFKGMAFLNEFSLQLRGDTYTHVLYSYHIFFFHVNFPKFDENSIDQLRNHRRSNPMFAICYDRTYELFERCICHRRTWKRSVNGSVDEQTKRTFAYDAGTWFTEFRIPVVSVVGNSTLNIFNERVALNVAN